MRCGNFGFIITESMETVKFRNGFKVGCRSVCLICDKRPVVAVLAHPNFEILRKIRCVIRTYGGTVESKSVSRDFTIEPDGYAERITLRYRRAVAVYKRFIIAVELSQGR